MTQENHLKAILKKYVLRTDLKTLKREFQSFGAQDEKTITHRPQTSRGYTLMRSITPHPI